MYQLSNQGRIGADAFLFSEIQRPRQPKGHTLVLFYDIHFQPIKIFQTLKFLKASLAPIYTSFEKGGRRKNSIFWSPFLKTS